MYMSINENGEVKACWEQDRKFLVQVTDGEDTWVSLMSAQTLIDSVDMSDCSYCSYQVFDYSTFGEIKPLVLKGTWHDPKDPLKIVVEDTEGNVLLVGYGTDH